LVVLAVNKADLTPQRKITESEIHRFAQENQIDVVKEISVLSKVEVVELFESLSRLILEKEQSDGGGGGLTMSEENRPQNGANYY
jgi:hypothetical protein